MTRQLEEIAMLRPKFPENPHLPTTPVQHHQHAPACSCQNTLTTDRPLMPALGIGAGAVGAVVAVGVVLTALLTAVALTAVAVTVCALVLRSLLNNPRR
jgi:hypothetical protein